MSSSNKAEDTLPSGWERHEDSEGAYYWHVKSGTIQRERPPHTQDGDDEMEAAAARWVFIFKFKHLQDNPNIRNERGA